PCSSASSGTPRPPHSFPTRRSSDLVRGHRALEERAPGDVEERPTGSRRHEQQEGAGCRRPEPDRDEGEREPGGAERHRRRDMSPDRKSTRLNSSHVATSYAVFCLKK